MQQIIIGVDPQKLSATTMLAYAKAWPEWTWAVAGANGACRPLAQRLLEAGESVVDVPAKLAARVRLFDTGHNRKTDALEPSRWSAPPDERP